MSNDRDQRLIEQEEDKLLQAQDELEKLEGEILWSDEEVAMEAIIQSAALDSGVDAPKLEEFDRVELAKEGRYLEALRAVLDTREGQIVLTHFVDQAKAFDRISTKGAEIYANAALNDYAQDRLIEIAMAGPAYFNKFLYQGMRNNAFEYKISKLLNKGR